MNLANAKKISIVGNSGAGKSTLSKKLGKTLLLEVYSIDKIFWLPGWKLRDKKSFEEYHRKWLKNDSWLIEGVGYWNEMERRLAKSDIIIFLDVPIDLCIARADMRIENEHISPNNDITQGCVYTDVKHLQMQTIVNFHHTLRPKLIKCLSRLNIDKVKIINSSDELMYK